MITAERRSVLVVDDDPTVLEIVSAYLERAGYSIRVAADGLEALGAAAEEPPDLIVLDLTLPGLDGVDVMRRLRAGAGTSAVIMLTARGEPADRVTGLRLGADDYMAKPFSPAELVARVDAVLRRVDRVPGRQPAIVFDGLEVDPEARRVTVRGEEVAFTVREFELLLFLARHPAKAFSRSQLMEAVWDTTFFEDTRTVPVHIRRVRRKIEPEPSEPRWIRTVWGVGYRFEP